MIDDTLLDRLDALEREFGAGETGGVFINLADSTDPRVAPYVIREEPGDHDPIGSYEYVELPCLLPKSIPSGVQILETEDVVRLWEIQPDDVRERELEYRIEHGEPTPPILQQ